MVQAGCIRSFSVAITAYLRLGNFKRKEVYLAHDSSGRMVKDWAAECSEGLRLHCSREAIHAAPKLLKHDTILRAETTLDYILPEGPISPVSPHAWGPANTPSHPPRGLKHYCADWSQGRSHLWNPSCLHNTLHPGEQAVQHIRKSALRT